MTTTEPNAGEQKRGRHAKSDDPERPADPPAEDREPAHAADDAPDEQPPRRPSADDRARGRRGAGRRDAEDDAEPEEPAERDEEPARRARRPAQQQPPAGRTTRGAGRPRQPKKKRSMHAIAHHPAGASLLTAAGLVTGLALAPLLFDQLHVRGRHPRRRRRPQRRRTLAGRRRAVVLAGLDGR